MTREELAKELNISLRTLSNWEKEKPNLVRLVNQGLSLDESIEEAVMHLERMKKIKEEANNKKFKTK